MVYHRSEPSSGDPRRHGRFSRDEDAPGANCREPRKDDRYESRSRDDRYSESDSRDHRDDRSSGRYRKEGRGRDCEDRSRSRDRSDGSRYRDNRDAGRGFDKSRFGSGSRFGSEEDPSYRSHDSGPRSNSGGSAYHFHSPGSYHDQAANHYPSGSIPYDKPKEVVPEEDKLQNQFQNDGSFLEMFKKMQQTVVKTEGVSEAEVNTKPNMGSAGLAVASSGSGSVGSVIPKPPIVGKRRGGRVLKTGMVKKIKKESPEEDRPKDAWSMYMSEVRKYKEASCEEEGKTRPLVK